MLIERTLIIVAALGLAGVAAYSLSVPPARRHAAPGLTLYDPHGGRLSLADMRGKVVVLNFWTTWCGVCREEVPFLTAIHRKFAGRGLEVAAVSLDDGWDEVKTFVAERQIRYPVFLPDAQTRRRYGDVTAVPTLILIDRNGRIAARHTGFDQDTNYTAEIAKLLAESAIPIPQ